MKIISLSGKKHSGKDTVFGILKEHDNNCVRVAFADALKLEVGRLFLNLHSLSDDKVLHIVNTEKEKYRQLLQAWGEARRIADPNYWVRKGLVTIKNLPSNVTVIITDCRYVNEHETLTKVGAIHWRIERANDNNDPHPSETELDGYKFDAIIRNEFTIAYLKQTVLNLYERK